MSVLPSHRSTEASIRKHYSLCCGSIDISAMAFVVGALHICAAYWSILGTKRTDEHYENSLLVMVSIVTLSFIGAIALKNRFLLLLPMLSLAALWIAFLAGSIATILQLIEIEEHIQRKDIYGVFSVVTGDYKTLCVVSVIYTMLWAFESLCCSIMRR